MSASRMALRLLALNLMPMLLFVPLAGCEVSCSSDADDTIQDTVDEVGDEIEDTADKLDDDNG